MDKSLIAALLLFPLVALGQTHTMPGSNVVPSGASLTIQSGGTINAAAGSTVTGFGGGGAPTTSTYITQTTDAGLSAEVALSSLATGLLKSTITTGALTTITDNSTNWNTAFTQTRQWDGGSTGLTAATGRTSLGGTTVGQSFFTLTNPGAATFPEISAANAVTAVSATTMRTDLGLAIGTNVQAFDADLTTWSGVTPTAGIQTWLATPSSANLRGALTDENGTGAALFSGATSPDFTTGFTIGGVAANNYELTGNGTNFVPKASDIPNGSSAQQTGFSANTYLTGSVITLNAGDFKVGSTYRCMFDMSKTTAGTAAPVITIYVGTAGTTSDTAAQTITFAAATGVADTGMFEVWVNFRAVGASATISSVGICMHNLAATGLTSTGAAGTGIVSNSTSSTFNSTTFTKIGCAFNGGASYVGTNNIVQAYYSNP